MVLTGKRGGFGAMKPMLRLMRSDPAVELQLVVTDQHVSDLFGRTEREVRQEFEIAAAVDMRQADASPEVALARLAAVLKVSPKPWRCYVLTSACFTATVVKF